MLKNKLLHLGCNSVKTGLQFMAKRKRRIACLPSQEVSEELFGHCRTNSSSLDLRILAQSSQTFPRDFGTIKLPFHTSVRLNFNQKEMVHDKQSNWAPPLCYRRIKKCLFQEPVVENPCCEGCWVTHSKVKPPTEVTKMCRCLWHTEDTEQLMGEKKMVLSMKYLSKCSLWQASFIAIFLGEQGKYLIILA